MPTDDHGSSAAEASPPSRSRVGFWLGLLLLFVPVFYPLLYLRRYSWLARTGWGLWLGLIVFAKVAGFAEPVMDLPRIEEQLREQERGAPQPDRSLRATFVRPENEPPPAPPLEAYLRELGGGVLGRRIADYAVDGRALRIRFQPVDWYLDSESALTLESIGVALSLFYGRDFERLSLEFMLRGQAVAVSLARPEFEAFFGMDAGQIRASLGDRAAQETSPFRAENLPPELQRAFFERFAKHR